MNDLIVCENISKTYRMGDTMVNALNGINLSVKRGEYLAILGPSGSGKSTLMNVLGCLDRPTTGSYFLAGEDVSQFTKNQLARVRNYKIGFIFQSFNLLPHATALENVALPLVYRGVASHQRRQRAEKLLAQVGLQDRMQHMPNELSGGQRQRVAIARALVTEPDMLLADEPTGNLDSQTGHDVIKLFEGLASAGKTILIVTHDGELARKLARVISIRDGKIVDDRLRE